MPQISCGRLAHRVLKSVCGAQYGGEILTKLVDLQLLHTSCYVQYLSSLLQCDLFFPCLPIKKQPINQSLVGSGTASSSSH